MAVPSWTAGDYQKNPEYHLERKKKWEAEAKLKFGEDYFSDQKKRWRLNNYEKYLLANARAHAKGRNKEFNITEEDIVIPDVCPILGIPLEIAIGKKIRDNSPSIDRIDSSLGYVKGNVQVVSWRANDLKSNGTLEEFRKLVTWLEDGKEL